MKKMLLSSLAAALTIFSLPSQLAFAHSYHYELQVLNTLSVNEEKQLESLKLSWVYDGDVSEIMMQDEKDLGKLGKTLIADLEKLAYFTQMKVNGKVVDFNKATDVKLEEKEINKDDQKYNALQLSFTLPIKTPVDLKGENEIGLVHEDPSAAGILYYESVRSLSASGDYKKDCKVSVDEKKDFAEGDFPQIVKLNCKL